MSASSFEECLSILPWTNTRKALNKLQDLLKCNKCNQLPESPQYMGRCEHVFCVICISNLSDNFCPVCKIPSPPCDRKPDIIVNGLVSSVSEMLTLINGGKVKLKHGLEAPDSTMKTERLSRIDKTGIGEDNFKIKETNPKSSRNTGKTSRISLDQDKTKLDSTENNLKQSSKAKEKAPHISKKTSVLNVNETNYSKCIPEKLSYNSNIHKNKVGPLPTMNKLGNKRVDEKNSLNKAKSTEEKINITTKNQATKSLSALNITPTTPVINKRNVKGETPLHIACIKHDTEKVKSLLEQGANPNTKDNAGWTPLHEACSHGFEDIAALLLEYGALINVTGNSNMTPLHDAIITGSVPLVLLLRRWGASDTIRDIYGRTASDLGNSNESLKSALATQKDETLLPKDTAVPLQNKIVFLDTNLTPEYKRSLEKVAKLLKAKILNDFSNDVTHLIVGCEDQRNLCPRTIKYMMAVVSGKRILSHKWLDACVSINGSASPIEYEVEGTNCNPCCLVPNIGRLNKSKMLPGLFSGCHFYFHGSFGGLLPTKKELENLIKAGDGVALQREPNPESITDQEQTVPYYSTLNGGLSKCSHFIIYIEGINEPLLKYDMSHIKSLPLSWLYNCIDQWCVKLSE